MLVSGKNKFIISPLTSEDELKKLVIENPDYFFGTNSFCLSKELFSDQDGSEAITDGFVIDIANKQWIIVNPTLLANNGVWNKIAPQVARQLVFAEQTTTKQMLLDLVEKKIREDKEIMKKFSYEGYGEGINGVFLDKINVALKEIFDKTPLIGMPIDSVSTDLNNWAKTLKAEVNLCVIKRYVENGNPENVIYEIPDESCIATKATESTEENDKEAKDDTVTNEKVPDKSKEKSAKDNKKSKVKASERFEEIEFI